MVQCNHFFAFCFLLLYLTVNSCTLYAQECDSATTAQFRKFFTKVLEYIRTDNVEKLSELIQYPLTREYLEEPIINKNEFLKHYPTLKHAKWSSNALSDSIGNLFVFNHHITNYQDVYQIEGNNDFSFSLGQQEQYLQDSILERSGEASIETTTDNNTNEETEYSFCISSIHFQINGEKEQFEKVLKSNSIAIQQYIGNRLLKKLGLNKDGNSALYLTKNYCFIKNSECLYIWKRGTPLNTKPTYICKRLFSFAGNTHNWAYIWKFKDSILLEQYEEFVFGLIFSKISNSQIQKAKLDYKNKTELYEQLCYYRSDDIGTLPTTIKAVFIQATYKNIVNIWNLDYNKIYSSQGNGDIDENDTEFDLEQNPDLPTLSENE